MPQATRTDLVPMIPASGLLGREGKPFHAHPDLVAAANVALAIGRPLLLTGEPGCGKTDFAYAVDRSLRGIQGKMSGFLECHVRSDSRARDLLYHYDALTRYGDAQNRNDAVAERSTDARNYVKLLPLGVALTSRELRVVLVDEIDKAPRDLPNDLLRELDQGCFDIPEIPDPAPPHPSGLKRTNGKSDDDPSRPLVIITSNVERQLPDAFLRRCIFYHIRFPDHEELMRILRDRFPTKKLQIENIVGIFEALRGVSSLAKKPATAELIDWTRALADVYESNVARTIQSFHQALRNSEQVSWKDLPGLFCLVKLREDLAHLRVC